MFRLPVRPDLELRLAVYSHAEMLFTVIERNREYLARWMPWVDHTQSPVNVADWIRSGLEQFARNEGWHGLLWHDDQFAGVMGFKPVDWTNLRVEIGYWLDERFQGKGLMTAAVRAGIEYAFTEWQLNRIEIHCATENFRSAAIPRRLGFAQEGIERQAFRVRDQYQDLLLFGLLREDWEPNRSGATSAFAGTAK